MIGVFDSGFGGLTVHRALTLALPQTDFVYLGDNRNAPYGGRPPIDILTLTCVGVDRLFEAGCRLVIIACNTSSTVALRWIQQSWLPAQTRADGLPRNVLGVVVPTIEAATGQRWQADVKPAAVDGGAAVSTIAVFATDRTVLTGSYPTEIHKRRPDLRVYQQACYGLVNMIENGADRDLIRAKVHKYVGELHAEMSKDANSPGGTGWPDRVILGCTHYPLVADLFAEALPPGTPVIDQPAATADAMLGYLNDHPEFNAKGTGGNTGQRRFLSTGYSAAALPAIERFWGSPINFETI